MNNLQTPKNPELFYKLVDSHNKEDHLKLIEMIKEENLNPCQIKSLDFYTILGVMLIRNKDVAKILVKYSDDSKVPDSLNSHWYDACLLKKSQLGLLKLALKAGKKSINHCRIKEDGEHIHSTPFACLIDKTYSNYPVAKFGKPIHYSYDKIITPSITFMLENGANINSYYGKTQKHVVSAMLQYYPFMSYYYKDILDMSLKNGFDPNNLVEKNTSKDNFYGHIFKQNKNSDEQILKFCTSIFNEYNIIPDIEHVNSEGKNIITLANEANLVGVLSFLENIAIKKVLNTPNTVIKTKNRL